MCIHSYVCINESNNSKTIWYLEDDDSSESEDSSSSDSDDSTSDENEEQGNKGIHLLLSLIL